MHKSCSPGAMAHSRRTGRFTVRRRPTTDVHLCPMRTATALPTWDRIRCDDVARSRHHARVENTEEPVGSESGDARNVLHSINIVSDLCLLGNYDTRTRTSTKSNRNSTNGAVDNYPGILVDFAAMSVHVRDGGKRHIFK